MSKHTYIEESAPKSFDSPRALRATAAKLMEMLELATDPSDVSRVSTAVIAACAEMRQSGKAEMRAIASFTDDQIVEHLKSISDRRRNAILLAAQNESLAGKPIF